MTAPAVLEGPDVGFDRDTHTYRINGVVVPSVTQVLNEERFIDFSSVPRDVLERAQARGTYVHQVLHYYLENDYDLADVAPEHRGYIDSALAFLETARMRPLTSPTGTPMAVEFRFWDETRMFAGTADYVAWDPDGVLAICDWKTGVPSDVAAPLQLAAYEYGVRRTLVQDYRKPIRRRAVKLSADGRPGRVEVYDDPRDLAQFFSALTCVHYRRNGMRHSR